MTNINIASANLILHGKNPLNIPGSWIVSTRRTYYDLIIGPFARKSKLIKGDSSLEDFSIEGNENYRANAYGQARVSD